MKGTLVRKHDVICLPSLSRCIRMFFQLVEFMDDMQFVCLTWEIGVGDFANLLNLVIINTIYFVLMGVDDFAYLLK